MEKAKNRAIKMRNKRGFLFLIIYRRPIKKTITIIAYFRNRKKIRK